MSEKLTFEQLKIHLWYAADILDEKGGIDPNEFRKPILGMLFLKRLNDQFEENAIKLEKKLSKKDAWEDPDRHAFFVPKDARWKKIEETFENIGEVLDSACVAIEQANSKLKNVFTNISYNNKEDYPDNVLLALVTHFSKKDRRLGNLNLENEDVFGQAYEYLLEQFADSAGKKAGEFFTPREVVRLLVTLMKPTEKMKICDPTCGSGGMLIWARKYLEEHNKNPKDITLHGQERTSGNYGMCVMNMIVHGIENFRIEKENIHTNPLLVENGKLIKYDMVIANYPFSRDWDSAKGSRDPFGRYEFGVPPSKGKADYAFIQHMYSILKNNGRAVIICSQGVLFRAGEEGKIRKKMVDADIIEAIIELPANLFYGTGIPAAILLLNKNKPDIRKNKILFIHAAKDYEDLRKRDKLREQDIKKIVSTYEKFEDIEYYCHVAPIDEIKDNKYGLTVPRYVDFLNTEEKIDLEEKLERINQIRIQKEQLETELHKELLQLDSNNDLLKEQILIRGTKGEKLQKKPFIYRKEIKIPQSWEFEPLSKYIDLKNGFAFNPLKSSPEYYSFGAEITVDFNLFRYITPFELGVRLISRNDPFNTGHDQFEFELIIGTFGF